MSDADFLQALDARVAALGPISEDHTTPEAVGIQLAQRVALDQLIREAWFEAPSDSSREQVRTRGLAIGEANSAALRAIVDTWGWITIEGFGPPASAHAFILVQHADGDPAFQAEMLERLEPLAHSGEIIAADYAYLHDRVAVAQQQDQRYGTQGRCEGASWQPHPIEAPSDLAARRSAVGLEPHPLYLSSMHESCLGAPPEGEVLVAERPCAAIDVEAVRAAGWSPGLSVMVSVEGGEIPVLFETAQDLEQFLASCEAPPTEAVDP